MLRPTLGASCRVKFFWRSNIKKSNSFYKIYSLLSFPVLNKQNKGATSRNAVDWSPSRRPNSELHSSEFSLSEDARIAWYAYLNYFYRVATTFQNFSVDFLEEGPLMSLPLPNVRTRFFFFFLN